MLDSCVNHAYALVVPIDASTCRVKVFSAAHHSGKDQVSSLPTPAFSQTVTCFARYRPASARFVWGCDTSYKTTGRYWNWWLEFTRFVGIPQLQFQNCLVAKSQIDKRVVTLPSSGVSRWVSALEQQLLVPLEQLFVYTW